MRITQWEASPKIVAGVSERSANEGPQNDPHAKGRSKVPHRHCLRAEVRALPYHGPHIGEAAVEPAMYQHKWN